MSPIRPRLWLPLSIVLTVMAATLLPVCGLLFSCGCAITTGTTHCNVHQPGVPHCPWCEGGGWVFGINIAAMLAAVAAAVPFAHRRSHQCLWPTTLAGLAAYALAAVAGAVVTAWAMGYPLRWLGHAH